MNMKIFSPTVHGVIDYAVAVLFLLAPSLFGFTGTPAALCYVLGAVHATMSALTRYPLSLAKLIPFKTHGVLEGIVAVFLIAAPWLFRFAHDSTPRLFFLATGVTIGAVIALTRYTTTSSEERSNGGVGAPSPTGV